MRKEQSVRIYKPRVVDTEGRSQELSTLGGARRGLVVGESIL